ncbi:MAG TPA: GH92 family glycosyl hydrolase [Prolixibacteraceae bacterium]
MRLILSLLWLTLILFGACNTKDVSMYVDPNIGGVAPLLTTKNPTVHRPHSMVRVFPITKPGLNDRYLSDKIYGFAVNMPAYRMGYVTELMPTSGKLVINRNEYASSYDHGQEEVHPWYHKVWLEDSNIEADWATTERAVVYRFKYNSKDSNKVIFRSERNASFKVIGNNVIQGWEEFEKTRQYFHAEFSQPFHESGSFESGKVKKDTEIAGNGIGLYVAFDSLEKAVEVRIGISYIDENQAAANLHKEIPDKSFESVKEESHQIWATELGKIRVEGGTEREKRIFYTSLYRCNERMVNISEDGRYFSGYDGKIHEDGGRPFFVDDWLWDTYRSLHPLMLILNPSQQADMVESYIRMYDQSGWMPGFPQFYGDFPAMIGFHSAALVWDTYQKGITNFDVEKAYEGLKKNATQATMLPWRSGPMCSLDSFYHKNGWYPALPDDSTETISKVDGFEKRQAVALTLEHSYDDWCLGQLAKALDKKEDYEYFMKRSKNYRNVFNPATGFFAPKMANGKWVTPFDPQLSGGIGSRAYYAENNAWTWNFSVQQDIPDLVALLGGKDAFVKRVDALFNEPTHISKWQFMGQFPDATGLNGMFVTGNEPSFHIPYLYNYAGKPWKTQRRIREIMDMWFDDRPLGIPGDEDGGGLCSWYVFSAMGFYPVTPGSGEYAIGNPFFSSIKIHLPNGETFSVVAKECSKKNKYIQTATLNGEELNRPFISHTDIANGGELRLVMGERPNKEWGTTP